MAKGIQILNVTDEGMITEWDGSAFRVSGHGVFVLSANLQDGIDTWRVRAIVALGTALWEKGGGA